MPESQIVLVHLVVFSLMGILAAMMLVVSSVHRYLQTRLPAGRQMTERTSFKQNALSDEGFMPGRTEFLRQRSRDFLELVKM